MSAGCLRPGLRACLVCSVPPILGELCRVNSVWASGRHKATGHIGSHGVGCALVHVVGEEIVFLPCHGAEVFLLLFCYGSAKLVVPSQTPPKLRPLPRRLGRMSTTKTLALSTDLPPPSSTPSSNASMMACVAARPLCWTFNKPSNKARPERGTR